MRRWYRILALLLLVGALALTGCSGDKGTASSGEVKVSMKNMAFEPKELKIKAGTKVTWVNDDVTDHSVSADKGLFKSGEFAAGKSFSYTFDKSGTYPISCATPGHKDAGMVMTVVVE